MRQRRLHTNFRGYTLVETLVCTGVLSVVIGLTLPAVFAAVTPGGIAVNNHSTVQMIAFNQPVDSRRFWPTGVQSSARQYNAITKRAQAPRIVRNVPKAATTAAPVVSDGDPSFRTYDLYSVSFLCFGILAIISGTILAWKRRS